MLTLLLFLLVSCETTYEPVPYEPSIIMEIIEDINESISPESIEVRKTPVMYYYSWNSLVHMDWASMKPQYIQVEEYVAEKDEPQSNTIIEEYDNDVVLFTILIMFMLILGTVSVIMVEIKKRNE